MTKSLFEDLFQEVKSDEFDYIDSSDKLDRFYELMRDSRLIYLDTEVAVRDPEKVNPFEDRLRLIQIGDEKKVFIVDVFKVDKNLLKHRLALLLKDRGVVGHNLKFDLKFLYTNLGVMAKFCFDTMIASQIVSKGKDTDRHSLKAVSNRYTGLDLDKSMQKSDWSLYNLSYQQLKYASQDIKVLRDIYKSLIDIINREHQDSPVVGEIGRVFGIRDPVVALEMAFLPALVEIELSGIPLDTKHLREMVEEKERYFQKIYLEFKTKFSLEPFSQQQVVSYLKNRLNLILPKTEKGGYSSQDAVLKNFTQHQEVRLLLDIRTTKKLLDKLKEISQYVVGGRVYGEFKQIGAATGRMASLKPNLQNIPSNLKDIFKTEEENSFIIADYSQIELRIAAEYTNDENMIDAFLKGKDLHRLTASIITGKNYDEVSSVERKLAKAINFGLIYGMSPQSLVDYAKSNYDIDISIQEATEFHKNFFQYYRGFYQWHNYVKDYLKKHRSIEVKTLFGRKIVATKFTDAVNYPIQGSGSDLLKMTVVLIYREKDSSCKVVNLVHDEILVETSDEKIEQNKTLIAKSMERAGKYILKKVPVGFEMVVSKNWKKD